MKRTIVTVMILTAWTAVSLAAQEARRPLRIGAHVAGNMMNGPFDSYRVGGQLVVPAGPRLAFYPSVSRFLDGAEWELSAALRYRPFGSRQGSSPLYLGVGLAGINWGTAGRGYDLWITGLELPFGRLRPYVELQFLGPLFKLVDPSRGWSVHAHSGLTWAVR